MRIEILGPSGVGKTTILSAAQGMRAPEPEWIGPFEANEILKSSPPESRKALTRAAVDDPDRADFIDHCISVVTRSSMLRSQMITALSILQKSCYENLVLESVPDDTVLVHDELLLHRAYSVLLYSAQPQLDAARYFELVPLPGAAVIVVADEEAIVSRVKQRESLPNCYAGQTDARLRQTVATGIEVAHVAAQVLSQRGSHVTTIDASQSAEQSARELHAFCVDQGSEVQG